MKLQEIFDGNFSVFSRMNDENKSNHINIVKYIDTISHSSGIDISNWDIFEVFGTSAGGHTIHLNKSKINKIFWERYQAGDEPNLPEPVDKESIGVNIDSLLDRLGRNFKSGYIRDLDYKINNSLDDANSYSSRANNALAEAARWNMEKAAYLSNPPDIKGEINKIIDTGFFKFDRIDSGYIYFITDNIVLKDRRPAAGIDITKDMGSFQVRINLSDSDANYVARVYPNKDNIRRDSYYHPHISHNGSICWGDATDTAHKALVTFRLSEAMMLLSVVLTDYNPNDPYVSLTTFADLPERACPECDAVDDYYEDDNQCHNCGYNLPEEEDDDEY